MGPNRVWREESRLLKDAAHWVPPEEGAGIGSESSAPFQAVLEGVGLRTGNLNRTGQAVKESALQERPLATATCSLAVGPGMFQKP